MFDVRGDLTLGTVVCTDIMLCMANTLCLCISVDGPKFPEDNIL